MQYEELLVLVIHNSKGNFDCCQIILGGKMNKFVEIEEEFLPSIPVCDFLSFWNMVLS